MKPFAFRSKVTAEYAYFVLLHDSRAPDVTTWNDYVAALSDAIERATTTVHVFAVTDGGGPGPGQRRDLAAAFATDRRGAKAHVFTTSAATRGIVTAFQWLARSRAVAQNPEDFLSVCERCQVPASAVLADLHALQRELPPVTLLAQVASVARRAAGAGAPRARE